MEEVADEVLGSDYSLSWIGSAYQEKLAGGASTQAFAFGLIMIFLILSAQYEKWSLPFVVLLSVPFAVLGALLAVWLRGIENEPLFPGRLGYADWSGCQKRHFDCRICRYAG